MDEISHNIETLIKADEKVGFDYERHVELRMELVRQVDEAGSHIKGKYSLINQMDTKVQTLEEKKHHSEAHCYKAMKDIDIIKV